MSSSPAPAPHQLFGPTPARLVHATARIAAGPGRARDAAEAWAWELRHYFLRGIGEQPAVTYADGVYTVRGLMTTTHPYDGDEVDFSTGGPWDLNFVADPARRRRLLELAARPRWDGT